MRTTVIVVTKNQSGLWATLRSVASQDHFLRLVVIDNGSDPPANKCLSPSGRPMMQEIAESVPLMDIDVHEPRDGKDLWHTIPLVLEESDYVCVVQPGDTLEPTAVGDMVYELECNPAAVACSGQTQWIVEADKDGNPLSDAPNHYPLSGVMYRTSAVRGDIGAFLKSLTGGCMSRLDKPTITRRAS